MKTKPFLRSFVLTALTSTVLVLSTLVSAAAFASPMLGAIGNYVPGEVIVKFKPTVAAQERTASVAAKSNAVRADLKHRWVHVKLGAGQTVETALTAYRNDPAVEYVQPNYIYHTTAVPNDPQYGQLWALKNIGQNVNSVVQGGGWIYTTNNPGTPGDDMNIEPAWGHITDCSSIVVAVVDTGVNYNQQDLAANMWNGNANHGWDYADGDSDPMDLAGHGTHVAGIIGATGNNSLGTTGVCWKASIMAVRVLDAMGNGTTANIIQGIDFAVTNGAKVINMSLGEGGSLDPAYSDAITRAQSGDVVVIVAAGNETNDTDTSARYPCNFTQANLLCVAALDQSYALADFSNWGATSVDVGAPGTNILSTWAGTNTTITDPLNAGWFGSSTTTGGGWFYSTIGTSQYLVDPSSYPSGQYNNSTDDRVYKAFNLSGNNVAILSFYTQFAVQSGDSFNVNYRSSGGDPFAGGVFLVGGSGTTPGVIGPLPYDISPCISATCSVGFQLLTDASGADQGVGILGFSIKTLTLNATNYNTENGTSMASPEVAGLAAMLRAYNPQYTYTDTINAIKNSGRPIAALAGKTTTGKAVDVMSSLAYIAPPTGLTATVQ